EIQSEDSYLSLAAAALAAPAIPSSRERITRYSFNATTTGRGGRFTMEEEIITPGAHPTARTILGGGNYRQKSQGYIVFHANMQSAQIMEIKDDKWSDPYRIARANAPAE